MNGSYKQMVSEPIGIASAQAADVGADKTVVDALKGSEWRKVNSCLTVRLRVRHTRKEGFPVGLDCQVR